MTQIPTPDRIKAMQAAATESRATKKAHREATALQVGPFTISLDAAPGVGWVLRGPKGTKENPAEFRVLKYYATREMAVAAAERLAQAPQTLREGESA